MLEKCLMAVTQGTLTGLYVPTTNIWDVNQIYSVEVNSPEFKELLVRLYQNLNLISTVLNLKDSAYYDTNEFVTGQSYFPDPTLNSSTSTVATYRPVYRKVINFPGGLTINGVNTANHGIDINSGFTFTRIYAVASDTTNLNYIPIPYASGAAGTDVELSVSSTQVIITTSSDRTSFNFCYAVLEFMKF